MNCTQGKQSLCLAAAWVGTLDSEIRLSKNTILFGGKMPLSGHLKEWRRCEAWRVETNHSCSWLWSLSDRWTEDEDCGSHSDDHTGDLLELKLIDHQKIFWTFSICIQSNEWKFFLLLLNRNWLNVKINFHLYLPLILWVTMIETLHSVCLFWLETWNKKLFEKLEKYLIRNFFMLQN